MRQKWGYVILFVFAWCCLQGQSSLPKNGPLAHTNNTKAKDLEGVKHKTYTGFIDIQGIDDAKLKRKLIVSLRQSGDSIGVVGCLQKFLTVLRAKGFAEARIDSFLAMPNQIRAVYKSGAFYYLERFEAFGVPQTILEDAGLISSPSLKRLKPFEWQHVERGIVYILQQYENDGYPFAAFAAPQIQYIKKDFNTIAVSIEYRLMPGARVYLDSVVPQGKIRERAALMQGIVQLKSGQVYSQRMLDAAPSLLNNSLYYQNAKSPVVVFKKKDTGLTAIVRIPLEQRRSNRFDAVLGFLPPQSGQSQFRFTALIDLQLVSALRLGEIIALKYDELPSSSRKIDFKYAQPGIFGTPFKAEFKFNLLRQDTLWLTRTFEPSLHYSVTSHLSAKVFYQNLESNLISTKGFSGASTIPLSIINGRSNLYGVGLLYEVLDYKQNPRKGVSANFDFSVGRKDIFRPPGIDTSQFDVLLPSQSRTELKVEGIAYRNISERTVLVAGIRGYWLSLSEYVQNDLIFVGGTRSLRGFNENQFLANACAIGTTEYRLLLDKDSYIGVFVDYGYLERKALLTRQVLHPWGVGFTLSLKTQAGLISVSYAVGQSELQTFQPANGRIHIGYTGIF